MPLPFILYKSFMSLSTSCLSSSFSLAMRSSHDSITTFSLYFSLQGLEQDLSIKSMQEVETSTLEIGIAQGIACSIPKESFVLLMLSNFNLSSSCFLLSKLNLHIKSSKFVPREAFRSLRALRFLISFDCLLMTFWCSWTRSRSSSIEGESESSSLTSLSIPLAIKQVLDDDPMRVVNFLFDLSLELALDSSPPLTHSPNMATDSCLGFFSFLCLFFLNFISTFMS